MKVVNLRWLLDSVDPTDMTWQKSDLADPGLESALNKAIQAGALVPCARKDISSAMRCFTVPKSDGSRRLIYDARPLNQLCRPPRSFEMETLPVILQNCRKDSWCASVDLKSAFWQIAIEPTSQTYFGIELKDGRCFRWVRLPFGFSWSPVIFSSYIGQVLDQARDLMPNTRIFSYLDDILVVGEKDELESRVQQLVQILESRGVTVSKTKSELKPVQEIRYLGFFRETGFPFFEGAREKSSKITPNIDHHRRASDFAIHSIRARKTKAPGFGHTRSIWHDSKHPRLDLRTIQKAKFTAKLKARLENRSDHTSVDSPKVQTRSRYLEDFNSKIPGTRTSSRCSPRHRCDANSLGSLYSHKEVYRRKISEQRIQICQETDRRKRDDRCALRSAHHGTTSDREISRSANRQSRRLLDHYQRQQSRPNPESTIGTVLVADSDPGPTYPYRLDRNERKLLCRPVVQKSDGQWGKYSRLVEGILEGLLAPSTARQYASVLTNFRKVAGEVNPTSEDSWLKWIDHRLKEVSYHTVAQNITEAKAALALKGVDLYVENPGLDRLLTRISARIRKIGRRSRMSKKNTKRDPRRVISLDEIKASWIAQLKTWKDVDWVSALNRVKSVKDIHNLNIASKSLETYVANITALLLGLRVSDIGLTYAELTPTGVTLTATNWKLSNPIKKRSFNNTYQDLNSLRTRTVELPFEESCDSPAIWVAALMSSKQVQKGFLLGKGSKSLSIQQVKNIINRLDLEQNYDHRFRVTHASYARASGIPDHIIQQWADWDHKGTIDIYERKVTPFSKWEVTRNYITCLGFDRSFGELSSK